MLPLPLLSVLIGSGVIEPGPETGALGELLMFPAIGAFMYTLQMKPFMDYDTAMIPFKKRLVGDKTFSSSIDAIGKLDELLSFSKFSKDACHPTIIPTVTDDDVHYFKAVGLRNPVQAKGDSNHVSNSVDLTSSRLTFITGPNSGGKTTYSKSIAQNQILGQIGGYALAEELRMNVADRISYQAPTFDALEDQEGRFGTELKRTKKIFYETTPKSLVILDELAEGTTLEEKMDQSRAVLNGFYAIGNNTLFVTHNHALVDEFVKEGMGQYLHVEFKDLNPTHKMIEGISRNSHAKRVAEKIGFSKEDIERHLKQKGYIS